ncbi:hypothetical protein PUN28_016062 [Cardiocondyla obscurior]|uniref:Transmembrane protein n=1 Tax=Cardiocondyla obscurior TaxID=286306 RepID=A0AAW2EQR9_9HYME
MRDGRRVEGEGSCTWKRAEQFAAKKGKEEEGVSQAVSQPPSPPVNQPVRQSSHRGSFSVTRSFAYSLATRCHDVFLSIRLDARVVHVTRSFPLFLSLSFTRVHVHAYILCIYIYTSAHRDHFYVQRPANPSSSSLSSSSSSTRFL